MRINIVAAALMTAVFVPGPASSAVVDKYNITPAEHAACDADAMNLCAGVAQDEDLVIACMKANRAQLTQTCASVFNAGLRRRHLSL